MFSRLRATQRYGYASQMLSPDECRRIDPALVHLSDEELAEAVALLDGLADVVLADWFSGQRQAGSKLPPGILPFLEDPLV
jgi:hypothetical protein